MSSMRTLQVRVDDEVAEGLDRVAPSRTRRRSEFVSMAIRKALWELEEQRTAEAYTRQPDSEETYLDPDCWES